MIKTEIIGSNVIRITAPEKLERADFEHLTPVTDDLIKKFGSLRLLIDATSSKGWKNVAALQHHVMFVKSHQEKVDRITALPAHVRRLTQPTPTLVRAHSLMARKTSCLSVTGPLPSPARRITSYLSALSEESA